MIDAKFSEYLREINVSETIIQRVSDLFEMWKPMLPEYEAVLDIFVEEYVSKSKEHEYLSLFLFTENFQIEIPNFVHTDAISIYPSKKRVDFLTVRTFNYDFFRSSRESEMTVEYSLGVLVEMEIHATGKNCDSLKKIIQTYLKPNLAL